MNTLLTALVNGSIAAAILAAATLMLTSIRTWNAASRYVIWWAALFASVAVTVVYFSADVFHQAPRSIIVQNQLPSAPVVVPAQNGGTLPAQQASSPRFIGRKSVPASLPIRVSAGSVLRWVGFAWMVASALMLVRLIASYLLLERRKTAAVPIGSGLDRRFRELFRHAGIGTRSIHLAVSDEIRGPIATGPHRPTVLIPARLIQELDAFELDQVVLHEAAHLSRRDDYAVFIERLIQALVVINPVVHWIAGRIDIEREIACDDVVVVATGKARPYASCLTRVAELCGCVAVSPLAASAAGSGSTLVQRIETLLDDKRIASSRPMKARLVLGAAAILTVTSVGIVAPRLVAFSSAADAAVLVMQLPVPIVAHVFMPPIPQASASAINVQVVVTDPLHRYVSGLQKQHFQILEQGVEQSITNFDGDESAGAASFCLVLDTNARNPNELLAQAKKRFQSITRAGDELCLVDPALQGPATSSLMDMVSAAQTRLGASRNLRRAIVIVSDQSPGSTEYSQEQFDALVRVTDVPIYALTSASNPTLDALAAQTGGRVFAPESAEDAEVVPTAVLIAIRNSYVLGFQPTKTVRAGEFHQLVVRYVPIKGLPPLTLKYRPGFYAPAR